MELLTETSELPRYAGLTLQALGNKAGMSLSTVKYHLSKGSTELAGIAIKLGAPELGWRQCYKCPSKFPKIPAPVHIEGSLSANFAVFEKEIKDIYELLENTEAAHMLYNRNPGQKEKAFLNEWLKQTSEAVYSWLIILILLVKYGIYTADQINSTIFEKLQNHIKKDAGPKLNINFR